MILNIAIIIFIVLESLNILIMYFRPDSKYGNSVSVFKEWNRSKENVNAHLFISYLVNWVANSKLIFVSLLSVIVIYGNDLLKVFAITLTIAMIGVYFLTLHPIITKLDQIGEITPKGYSRTLGATIVFFIVMFSTALFLHFIGLKI